MQHISVFSMVIHIICHECISRSVFIDLTHLFKTNTFLQYRCIKFKPVNPKGNQPWILIGRTDDEAEAPTLWPPDVKSWLTGKDPDAGKDWGEEKGRTEDEMVGWHHQLDGHEFEQTPGDSEVKGNLACCSPWGHRVRHNLPTEQQI